jgi:hypothetical protein
MRSVLLAGLIPFAGLAATAPVASAPVALAQAQAAAFSSTAAPLRHVVLFDFRDSATPADIARIEAAFVALRGKIREVKGLEWGTNVSPENLANGFTHCFIVTFDDAAGRDTYLPHPDHKAFVALAGPYIEKALVVDFFAFR